jgi:hypothetical protein
MERPLTVEQLARATGVPAKTIESVQKPQTAHRPSSREAREQVW